MNTKGKTVVEKINYGSEPWRKEEFMKCIEEIAPEKISSKDGFDPVLFWTVGASTYAKLKSLQKTREIPDAICRFIVKTHKIANDAKNIAAGRKQEFEKEIEMLKNIILIHEKESEEIMDENIELKKEIARLKAEKENASMENEFIKNLHSCAHRSDKIKRIRAKVERMAL